MTRRIAVLVVGAFLLLVPTQAMAYLCLSVCNQFAPCDRVCQKWGGGPFTTCGEWGDCQGSGSLLSAQPGAETIFTATQGNEGSAVATGSGSSLFDSIPWAETGVCRP